MIRMLSTVLLPVAVLSLAVPALAQQSLDDYVTQCMTELGFWPWELQDMDCNDGLVFDDGLSDPNTNDCVLNVRVNDQVDATLACRWLQNDQGDRTAGSEVGTLVSGVELLIHNRYTGGTCFFAAQGGSDQRPGNVSAKVVSPTNILAGIPPSDYWATPTYVDQNVRCVNCHTAGPYIATPLVAPFLGSPQENLWVIQSGSGRSPSA